MTGILDSPRQIEAVDRHGMLEALKNFPKYCREALKLGLEADLNRLQGGNFVNVVFLGMGGSAIGGNLLKDWAYGRLKVPFEVCRDSEIPGFLGEGSLAIAISYSGNTFETLKAFREALKRGSHALTISSGGKLAEESLQAGVSHIRVPGGLQPRAALPYLMIPAGLALERLGLLENFQGELEEAVKVLDGLALKFGPESPVDANPAKQLALGLHATLPVIYGFREYSSVAYRFKTQLNENSKIFCKYDVFPELDHNEIVGWEGLQPFLAGRIHVVILRDKSEPAEISAIVEAVKEIIAESSPRVTELYGEGETRLAKMLSLIYLCDYTSFYLAILNGVDPTPVSSIAALKRKLAERLKGEV